MGRPRAADRADARSLDAFEKSGAVPAVGRDNAGLRADFILETELRDFAAVYDSPNGPPRVTVASTLKLIKIPERKIVAQQRVIRQQPAAGNDDSGHRPCLRRGPWRDGRGGRPVGGRHSRFVVVAAIGILTPFRSRQLGRGAGEPAASGSGLRRRYCASAGDALARARQHDPARGDRGGRRHRCRGSIIPRARSTTRRRTPSTSIIAHRAPEPAGAASPPSTAISTCFCAPRACPPGWRRCFLPSWRSPMRRCRRNRRR